jgi:hypothetical protein
LGASPVPGTDFDLVDPANTALGHKQVQWWNVPEGWVISKRLAPAALVSEADFIAAQDATATRGPAGPATRRSLHRRNNSPGKEGDKQLKHPPRPKARPG